MRPVFWAIALFLLPATVTAQSREVRSDELSLSVRMDARDTAPFVREMVLITIRGEYRRHVTREAMVQPDLDGFSWAQLGEDRWQEQRIDGKLVKVFERRMALYPDRPGRLTIGAFTHRLTLTDEGDDWFEHEIRSPPVAIDVAPQPNGDGWWFPVSRLRVSDQWSNSPELLKPGEGVLRVVRIEALGATPEMIPPMPELNSPSGMVFPHPEKRLVELSPAGPITYAFWRWTIRPTNGISTIVEPLAIEYFDSTTREHRKVEISAQRVAYGSVVPQTPSRQETPAAPFRLPSWPLALLAGAVAICGGAAASDMRGSGGWRSRTRPSLLDPSARALRRAARRGDMAAMRRSATAILARNGEVCDERRRLLGNLDRVVFSPGTARWSRRETRAFARSFLRSRPV